MAVPNLPLRLHVKQTITHRGIKLNFVTYNNIRLKCYLKFVYLAPRVVEVSPILARAIAKFYSVSHFLKKNYLFLATYSWINSITISLIVVCFLAAITFRSVFNFSSIVICNVDSPIFYTSLLICYFVVSIFVELCIYNLLLLST